MKINLSIAGIELRQSQGEFSLQRRIFEISFMI